MGRTAAAPGPYLTVDEVAERMRCEHRTVRRAIHAGDLEAAMIGGKWLIRQEAVDAWFDARRTGPRQQASQPARTRRGPSSLDANRAGSVARLKAIEGSGG
jgi:excisionase family DNA binding protein